MAVAFGNVGVTTAVNNVTSISFPFTNSGNAICILAKSDYSSYAQGFWTGTYAGQALTNDFTVADPAYGFNYFNYAGFHKLNAAASGTVVLTCSQIQNSIDAVVVSVSGASTSSFTGTSNVYSTLTVDDAVHTTPALNAISQTNDLVVSFFSLDCDPAYSFITGISGTTRLTYTSSPASTLSWAATTAGASPTIGLTGAYYGAFGDSTLSIYFLASFSFAPSGVIPSVTKTNQIIGPQVGVWTSSYLR